MVPSGSVLSHFRAGVAWAQSSADPFTNQGLIYALSQDQWREAMILSRAPRLVREQQRWFYRIQFLDGARELKSHLTTDQIRTIFQAQAQGLTTRVYDLSTQAGVDEIVAIHNQLRRQVGVQPLTWSPELAGSAQAWAEVLLANEAFQHSPPSRRRRGMVGENLHQRRTPVGLSYATPSGAIAGWVNEQNFYTYPSNTCAAGRQCGHYLQMVWSDTRQMGCGMARTADARREVWASLLPRWYYSQSPPLLMGR
ncbi:MAG: hypothetical protein KME14_22335 [Tildeniella torsiva UHER 1998/13D]|jgi:uncharacterized protein YkwD|nr:hypothetical protein [Tildeniella torsiva UHER 1998/13D]